MTMVYDPLVTVQGTLPNLVLALAVGADGDQWISDPDGLRPPGAVPAAPTGLTAPASSSSSVTVAWAYTGTDHEGFRTQYWRTGVDNAWQTGATLDPTARGWTVTGMPPTTDIGIRVVAFNEFGASPFVEVWRFTTEQQEWQLPAGHFEPSQIPIDIIGPRPDTERSVRSRYSWAYPGLEYAVPIVVLGGSYPHYYEIVARTGPASLANATIGNRRAYGIGVNWYETKDWEDYGTLRWTPAAGDEGQTFSFTIKVTGQDGASATVTYSGKVQADKFVFLDANAAPGGTGSITAPFIDFDDLWVDKDDTRFDGKILVFRAGRYDPTKLSTRNLQNNLNLACVFIGYPGDAKWVMDQGLGDGASWSVGRPDLWLSDCYVDGCYNSADTNNWFWKATWWSSGDSPSQSRMTVWNNVFHDFQGARAVPGDSNCGWFSFLSPRYPPQYEQRQHFTLAKNIFDGGTPTTSAGPNYGSCCDFYGTKNSVIEHNIVKKWGIYFPFWLKVQDHHWSIRANLNWDQGDFNATTRANQTVSTPLSEYVLKGGFVEYCWNFSWSASGSHFGTQEYDDGQANPFYVYRNTGVTTGTKYVAPFGILHADDMEENAEPTNVAIGLNNLAIDMKIDATNKGPWRIITWDGRVSGTQDDAAAKAVMPLGTFNGNVWGQQILIDFTTGAATGAWDVHNGLKGAYIV